MDTQKRDKRNVIGLGALSVLLGLSSKSAHNFAKKSAAASKLKGVGTIPLIVKDAKLARNILGAGAGGAALGSAILANKYYKNKKKVVTRTPTDEEMKRLLKGQPDARGYKGG